MPLLFMTTFHMTYVCCTCRMSPRFSNSTALMDFLVWVCNCTRELCLGKMQDDAFADRTLGSRHFVETFACTPLNIQCVRHKRHTEFRTYKIHSES